MNCSFTEKISLLVDGELSVEEVNRTRKHLSECGVCRKAHEDFLLMREQIKSFEAAADSVAERESLLSIRASKKTRWWTRQIRMPVPAFALFVIAMLALAVWALARNAVTEPTETKGEIKRAVESAASERGQTPEDLSRFDRGARAVIYKARLEKPRETSE